MSSSLHGVGGMVGEGGSGQIYPNGWRQGLPRKAILVVC
jgi:hypothetical protein